LIERQGKLLAAIEDIGVASQPKNFGAILPGADR